MATSPDKPELIDAVFGGQPAQRPVSRAALAWIAALGLHASLWFLAQLSGPSLETWSARIAAMVHRDLNANAPTAIETLRLPEPAAAPPPPPAAARVEPTPPPAAATRVRAPEPKAAPAQAAKIIAADAPVDLTADTFVTGSASAYAGGATTSSGTSASAVSKSALETPAPALAPAAVSSAPVRAVSLTSEQWHCPWPAAALEQDLYEQFVIVRAWVRADGSVERASVLSDPGYGFGSAAITCALHTRFNPARNARGEAVRALSPPIRVRFTR